MSVIHKNPQQNQNQYLRTKVQTAAPEELVLMLYDGVIRFCRQGKEAFENDDKAGCIFLINRAQLIVMELLNTLDRDSGGEIAENLAQLYAYSLNSLLSGALDEDLEKVDEIINIFRELREGWSEAMGEMKKVSPGVTAVNPKDKIMVTGQPAPKPATAPKAVPPRPAMQGSRLSVQG